VRLNLPAVRNLGIPAVAWSARRPNAAAARTPASLSALIIPITLVITSAMPSALQIVFGTVLVTPSRVLGMISIFVVIPAIVSGNRFNRNAADWFVMLFAFWASISFLVSGGTKGIQSAGAIALESIVPYFIGRVYITDSARMSKVAVTMMLIVWAVLPLAFVESMTRVHIVQEALGAKIGNLLSAESMRYGILRAMATFDHPILYGVFCALVFPAAWYILPRRWRILNVTVIAASVVLSASSAAYLGFALIAALILWERFTTRVQHRWQILLGIMLAAITLIGLVSNRPLTSIIAGSLSFSSSTGWIRLLQWNFGWANVWDHWLLGLGSSDWVRPYWLNSSIDDYWLLNAMLYGIPGLIGVAGATLSAIVAVGRGAIPQTDHARRNARIAWVFAIVMLSVVGLSVDYWKGMQVLFFFMIGQGMFLGWPRAVSPRPAR
jgi:hypothetical protein